MSEPHEIYPHSQPIELEDGLWRVNGSLPRPITRAMTIWRMPDGGLLLYSVVAMDDDGMQALAALGEPKVMVVPHPFHILDAGFYKARFPDLYVIAPEHAARRIAKHATLPCPVDATPEEGCAKIGVRHRIAPGMKYVEVDLDLDVANGRALVFSDLFTAMKPKNLVERMVAAPRGGLGLARIVRHRQVIDRAAVAAYFRELSELADIRWLLPCHGKPVSEDCSGVLARAAEHT